MTARLCWRGSVTNDGNEYRVVTKQDEPSQYSTDVMRQLPAPNHWRSYVERHEVNDPTRRHVIVEKLARDGLGGKRWMPVETSDLMWMRAIAAALDMLHANQWPKLQPKPPTEPTL